MGMRDLIRHEYAKAFEEVDFPPLSSLQTSSPAPIKPKPDVLVHEPALNTYAVKDSNRNIIFRAFKIRNLD
jgi:hypothetical protein